MHKFLPDDKNHIAIEVKEFMEIPMICKPEGNEHVLVGRKKTVGPNDRETAGTDVSRAGADAGRRCDPAP